MVGASFVSFSLAEAEWQGLERWQGRAKWQGPSRPDRIRPGQRRTFQRCAGCIEVRKTPSALGGRFWPNLGGRAPRTAAHVSGPSGQP